MSMSDSAALWRWAQRYPDSARAIAFGLTLCVLAAVDLGLEALCNLLLHYHGLWADVAFVVAFFVFMGYTAALLWVTLVVMWRLWRD